MKTQEEQALGPIILGLLFCFQASVGMFYNYNHRTNNENKGSQSCRIN